MKHHLYFFVITLIVANSCTAMQTLQITKELPAIKHKRYISFLTDEELIIQGKESWDIIDSKTHKTITTLDNTPDSAKIDIHPNHKTFMIFGKGKINIYDTKTKQLLSQYLSKQEISSVLFDPLNNQNIYIMMLSDNKEYSTIIKHRSNTNLTDPLLHTTCYDKFCAHPISSSLCFLNTCFLSLPSHNTHTLVLPFAPYGISYNPDGSVIIARHRNQIITIDPSKFTIEKSLHSDTFSEFFEDAKMYSNNLLALLVATEVTDENKNSKLLQIKFSELLQIKFYNLDDLLPDFQSHRDSMFDSQPQPVAQTKKIEIEMIWERKAHTFSFSPDGKQCMAGFHHKALVFDIPFEIMYEPETKEKLSYLLFVLKNCEAQLPTDIVKLLVQTSLETYKRYHLK